MDLSPRTLPDTAASPTPSRRRWAPIVLVALVLVAGGVIVTQFLRSAVDYYCNVDEIGRRDGCEEHRRLRVQGTVDAGSVHTDGARTAFTISFHGATLPVRYDGQPGGIFEECQPVVVHGELVNGTFEGDRVEVKHSNEYVAENADRLDSGDVSAESGTCSPPA
ncbi:MAG: cytochrome c maturation protein CcmE [Acidimicrobiia bacterium]|nr:cytochrome c maturation protein CcmE [Acidimicrobiia bacterium]